MGYYKDLMIEEMNNYRSESVADALGIDYNKLIEQDFDLEPNEDNDGIITSYRLVFSEDTPVDFLQTIPGIDAYEVELSLQDIESESPFDYEYEAIYSNNQLLDNFNREIDNLRKLNEVDLGNEELNKILLRQIYIGTIGSMETFLSETFLKLTLSKPENLERFIKSHPNFKVQKFELREVFEAYKNIEKTAKGVILDTIFHNLSPVRQMYRSTLQIPFPAIGPPLKCVHIRYDLVHRNGKTIDQQDVVLDKNLVNGAIETISEFIHQIAEKIPGNQIDLPF